MTNRSSEKIRMHAERDHEITVKHAETRTIGETFSPGSASRSTTIKNGDDHLTIESGNPDHARYDENLDRGGHKHNAQGWGEQFEHYKGIDKP